MRRHTSFEVVDFLRMRLSDEPKADLEKILIISRSTTARISATGARMEMITHFKLRERRRTMFEREIMVSAVALQSLTLSLHLKIYSNDGA